MTNHDTFYLNQLLFMMKKLKFNTTFSNYYLFNSRLLTHVVFWVLYYVLFSLVWANKFGLFASFYLEFILLPLRILCTYSVLYWLMPQYLLKKQLIPFGLYLALLLLACGLLQRVIIFAFYEELLIQQQVALFDFWAVLRSCILINTTVMLAMTIKWYGLFHSINDQIKPENKLIEVKSNRRTHLINPEDINYIEGLGNYINIHLTNGTSLTTYSSIKKFIKNLPDNFIRCHRSFVVNKNKIESYNQEDITIGSQVIPKAQDIDFASNQ
jgi:two-component system response regulator LytT